MNLLEDEMEMILLYHHIPSTQTVFGHSCCAYSNPAFGRMFKINAKTNSAGLVDLINVTIFGSLEVFSAEVCVDLSVPLRYACVCGCHFQVRVTDSSRAIIIRLPHEGVAI